MTVWWPSSIEAGAAPGGVALRLPEGATVSGRLRPPSSKSLTHRALALALLSRRAMTIERPLAAEDTELFLAALTRFGFAVERSPDAVGLRPPERWPAEVAIDCGNAGTMFRFLVAIAATLPTRVLLDGVPRLRERPIAPLTSALAELGVAIEFLGERGHAPLVVGRLSEGTLSERTSSGGTFAGGKFVGGKVALDASASSQYLSALLLAGLRAAHPVEVAVEELASAPYVDLTLEMVARFGGRVERLAPGRWRSYPGLAGTDRVAIEADFSAATYPAAAAVLTGGSVQIDGIARSSRQGDRRFFDLLGAMGAEVRWNEEGARVSAGAALSAIVADLGDIPDQVPTLAALAPFARGTTEIRNVAHLRIKESDRLAAITSELRRAGAEVEELADGLVIPGIWAEAMPPSAPPSAPPSIPVVVDPHRDHRIAMAMALVALRRPNLSIGDPACVAKSHPEFWRDLAALLGIAA